METLKQRSARRAMSGWLTAQINNVEAPNGMATPAIRIQVLWALAKLKSRIVELNLSLQENYHVTPGRDLVKFYMKGGNAFECVRNLDGPAATQNGGGTSDWDTQIVVDPWAPVPLQAIVYGLVEELVTDTMIQAGVEIAQVAGAFASVAATRWDAGQGRVDGVPSAAYALEYDDPQSMRQVFDQQRLGLWTNDRRRVSAPNIAHPGRIPGILLNDGIRPFILHRLGYTWHATLKPHQPARRNEDDMEDVGDVVDVVDVVSMEDIGDVVDVADIHKPVLMELIDVTLPRRDTIEAVAVWEELAQGQVTITDQPVKVNRPNGDGTVVLLPLPDIMYHLREIATMLCEIADGSSRHPDKLWKRFDRIRHIWDANRQRDNILRTLGAMAGVVNIQANSPLHHEGVDDAITLHGGNLKDNILAGGYEAYKLARNLMDRIAWGTDERKCNFTAKGHVSRELLNRFDLARIYLRNWVEAVCLQIPDKVYKGIRQFAFSDDLAMIGFLEQGEYIAPEKIGFSGVLMAAVIRVNTQLEMDALRDQFATLFDRRYALEWRKEEKEEKEDEQEEKKEQERDKAYMPWAAAQPNENREHEQSQIAMRRKKLCRDVWKKLTNEQRAALTQFVDVDDADALTSVRFRAYSVPRPSGFTHEMTMVLSLKGKVIAYMTVTTANESEVPFRADEVHPNMLFASLPEIATQRKIAAALTEDFLIRKAITRQYEALKTLLPVM